MLKKISLIFLFLFVLGGLVSAGEKTSAEQEASNYQSTSPELAFITYDHANFVPSRYDTRFNSPTRWTTGWPSLGPSNDRISSISTWHSPAGVKSYRFFTDSYFRGYFFDMKPGEYVANLQQEKGKQFQDSISSILIVWDDMVDILLYEHDNYQGKAMQFIGNESNLKDKSFNDKISSIEIKYIGTNIFSLYEHADYKGHYVSVRHNISKLSSYALNDKGSSVRLFY
jgi:hypothetical protein